LLFVVVVLTLGTHELLASTTRVAGTCKPTLPSYPSISAALAATPPLGTVLVCPQTFNEQVQITQQVTLQGISIGGSDQPVLAPPSGGLTQTAYDFADPMRYQLWVNNVSGPVNISNITIDGTGNGVQNCYLGLVVGILYQNSPGTVNRVTTRNQKGNAGCGYGVWLEGGSSNPSVTIENGSIHDFDVNGIEAITNSGTSELTATIKGNDVNGVNVGIAVEQGATAR
jgi:hypothetical protein